VECLPLGRWLCRSGGLESSWRLGDKSSCRRLGHFLAATFSHSRSTLPSAMPVGAQGQAAAVVSDAVHGEAYSWADMCDAEHWEQCTEVVVLSPGIHAGVEQYRRSEFDHEPKHGSEDKWPPEANALAIGEESKHQSEKRTDERSMGHPMVSQ